MPLLSSGLIPSIILFSALSFHSLMAGLSLGVSDQTAWAIFISILAHKAFAAFALGASFVRHLAVSRRTIACWMLAFSVTTPTGVMLGTALTTVRAVRCLERLALCNGSAASHLPRRWRPTEGRS